MGTPLRVLIVEDSEDDALLVLCELRRGGYAPISTRVDTPEAMAAELERETWDIVISDYVMPRFTGLEALKLMLKKGLDLPFIVTSGKADEETLVGAMKAGGSDYIMKNNLSRLVPAVERELREAAVRREKKKAEEVLRESEELYHSLFENMLNGFAYCKMLFHQNQPQDFIYLNVNTSFEVLTGLKNVVGKKVSEVIPGIRESDPKLFEIYGRVALSGRPERFEIYVDALGAWFWISVYSPGKEYFVAVFDVITERKRAEEAQRESEKAAKRLAQENGVMAEIGRVISSTMNIEEVYDRFAEEVRKLIPFDRIVVSLNNLEEGTITVTYASGMEFEGKRIGDVFPLPHSVNEEIMRSRAGLLVQPEAVEELEGRFPLLISGFQAGLRSLMSVPLISRDQVIGAMHLRSKKPKAYTDRDMRLAERIGAQIAGAIANAQLFLERKQAEEERREALERAAWLARLPEENPNPVARVSAEGSVLYRNPAAAELPGWVCEVGKPLPDTLLPLVGKAMTEGQEVQQDVDLGGRLYSVSVTPFLADCYANIYGHDITELEAATEALSRKTALLSGLLDSIPDIVFFKDCAGVYLGGNPEFSRFVGRPRAEIVGRTGYDFFPKERADSFSESDRVAMERGEPWGIEQWLDYPDGRRLLVETIKAPLRSTNGETIGLIGVSRDITERKLAEERLQRSEEAARGLAQENTIMAEIGRIISSTLNIEEVYERFAAEARKLIPFDRIVVSLHNPEETTATVAYASGRQLGGRKIGDVYPLPHTTNEEVIRTRAGLLVQPETMEELEGRFPIHISSFQAGLRSTMSVPLISRDQVIGVLHLRSKKPKAYTDRDMRLAERIGAQIAGAIANAQLFLERKRAEKALREQRQLLDNILNSIPTPVFYKDLKGTYLGCNLAYLDNIGLPRESVIGKTISEIVPAELAEIYLKADQDLIRNGGSQVYEAIFPYADGSVHEVMMHKAFFSNVEGAISGIVGVIFDISERKRAEEALQRSEEAARRLAQKNTVMAEIGRIIGSTLNIEEVYERFAEEVRNLIQFDRMAISIVDPEDGTFFLAHIAGPEVADRRTGKAYPLAGTGVEEVMQTRSSLLIQGENQEQVNARLPSLLPIFQAGFESMMLIPLISKDQVIGVLNFQSFKANAYAEMDMRLAERVAAQIAGAMVNAQLFLERKRAEEHLKASLKEKEVLLREIHHRVKNNLQVISSLLRLQARYIEDDAIRGVFKESQDRVKTMAIIHEKLYQSTDLARIDFAGYIRDLTANLYRSYGVSQETIGLRIHAKNVFLGINMAIPCGLIINELVSNCLKHAFPGGKRGEIYIDLSSDHGQIILTVGDNGGAFPKGLDFRNTQSLGLQLVLSLIEQLEGAIELHSDGQTEFRIAFPAGHNK